MTTQQREILLGLEEDFTDKEQLLFYRACMMYENAIESGEECDITFEDRGLRVLWKAFKKDFDNIHDNAVINGVKSGEARSKIVAERNIRIMEEINAGAQIEYVARKFNVSRTTVWRIASDMRTSQAGKKDDVSNDVSSDVSHVANETSMKHDETYETSMKHDETYETSMKHDETYETSMKHDVADVADETHETYVSNDVSCCNVARTKRREEKIREEKINKENSLSASSESEIVAPTPVADVIEEAESVSLTSCENDKAEAKPLVLDAQARLIELWQTSCDKDGVNIFPMSATIENAQGWYRFWRKSPPTVEQVETAFRNIIDGINSGAIEPRFIPATPDRFVLRGGITRYQKPIAEKEKKGKKRDGNNKKSFKEN